MTMNNFQKLLAKFLVTLTLSRCLVFQVESLNFNYSIFAESSQTDFIRNGMKIHLDNIQVTPEARGAPNVNKSGRIWYNKPLKLWSKKNKNVAASFNTTFVLNISPYDNTTATNSTWGYGIAFILSETSDFLPENSYGKWLGIVNETTNGSSANNIVAVEFDTNKSYLEDIDDNHVGVDINSVYSVRQESLTPHGVILASDSNVTATIQYKGQSKELAVFVHMTNNSADQSTNIPIISMPLDLSDYLPHQVFVGFSASTGEYAELNCIRSWSFTSTEIDDDDNDMLWMLWVGIAILVLVVVVSSVLFYWYWTRTKVTNFEDPNVEQQINSSATAPHKFQLRELKRATGNFDPKNMLGSGGCGVVYRGLLSNKEVAVKRFLSNSSQGKQEFVAEITIIGNLHHKNLVKLVGWCYENQELLLVYEFMPNGSLDKMIFRNEKEVHTKLPRLSWEKRHVIISGVAQALDYLHNGCENRVLHRDIKASNIMLDTEFYPRLGDFGLARTIIGSGKTHHSTQEIAGTPGYMAPEIFHTGKATVETDVYAFGVLVLEVACERRPEIQTEDHNLSSRIMEWVWLHHERGRIIEAIDVEANRPFDRKLVECLLELGLACCHPNPYERPSMRTVLQVLKGEASSPPIPREKPVFMWPSMALSPNEIMDKSPSGSQLSSITILVGR